MADTMTEVVMGPLETHLSESFEEMLAAMMLAKDDLSPWGADSLQTLSDLIANVMMAGRLYADHEDVRDTFAGVLLRLQDEQDNLRASLERAFKAIGVLPVDNTAQLNV